MIQPLIQQGRTLGETLTFGKIRFVFGSSALDRASLEQEFPKYRFAFLHQVHEATIVPAVPESTPVADGQITDQLHLGLVIQTADCVPLLLANDSQICALHAGWRGTAKGIVGATAPLFSRPPEFALIGPHIQFSSFEVGRDVADMLLASAPAGAHTHLMCKDHADPVKCYFDLSGLLRAQLQAVFPQIQIFQSDANTLKDMNYHSFRRNGPNAGRQFSFVVKIA